MTPPHTLHVSTGGEAVGQLEFQSREDRYGFAYTANWQADRKAYYLAPSIPLEPAARGSCARHRLPRQSGIQIDGALSSTHLLKPESGNPYTPFMVANEHYCMSLAARLRLPVAAVRIRRIPEPILLIERFDRHVVWDRDVGRAKGVERRHVIDGCQALDLPSTYSRQRRCTTLCR
jgi:hypothetical protein